MFDNRYAYWVFLTVVQSKYYIYVYWVSAIALDQNNKCNKCPSPSECLEQNKASITEARAGYAVGWPDGTRTVSSVKISVTLEFSAEGPSIVSGFRGLMVTVNWDGCMLKPGVAINGELEPPSNLEVRDIGFVGESNGAMFSR
jgi:hypothetical protein